jgi:hypothetical protein
MAAYRGGAKGPEIRTILHHSLQGKMAFLVLFERVTFAGNCAARKNRLGQTGLQSWHVADDWGAWIARLGVHSKDYDPVASAFDFVFTVSNFRLCVVNLQPLDESFEVSCPRSSDGVSSLDFGPASCGAFFASHFHRNEAFFPASPRMPVAARSKLTAFSIPKKDHNPVK